MNQRVSSLAEKRISLPSGPCLGLAQGSISHGVPGPLPTPHMVLPPAVRAAVRPRACLLSKPRRVWPAASQVAVCGMRQAGLLSKPPRLLPAAAQRPASLLLDPHRVLLAAGRRRAAPPPETAPVMAFSAACLASRCLGWTHAGGRRPQRTRFAIFLLLLRLLCNLFQQFLA